MQTAAGMSSTATAMDREFLENIIDHIAHPIFVKDRSCAWVMLNRAFCDLVGYPRAGMLGKSDYDFFPQEEAEWFRKWDLEMFTTGKTVDVEERITDANGRRHVLWTTKVPMRAADGQTYLVGIFKEITRLKEAEEALRLANEQLDLRVHERTAELEDAQHKLVRRERLAVLGRLAGGVAHQIRNPLAAINNAAYILQRELGAETRDDVASSLEVIHEEVRRANQLIVDLIDYARVRAPVRRPVTVGYVVEQALGSLAIPAGIKVVSEFPELTLVVDPDQTQSALCNLIRNAIDAMPDGGTLTLAARAEHDYVVVTITDTGHGIPEAIRERLFEPLVTTKAYGLGLGLVTARTLIEAQGGTITGESLPGGGARFEMRLPAAEAGM